MGAHVAVKKKANRGLAYLAIASGIVAISVGGVFAANLITINSGSAIEFGQGVATTSTCDSGLSAAINQTYNSTDSKFYVSTLVISGIRDFDCAGKSIKVSLIGSSGTICSVDGTHTSGTNQDSFVITDDGTTGSNDDVSRTVTVSGSCDATSITKVSITTSS
jgi:hypothetical protein